jgi:type IV secretory pathway TraG/TraD family ATPase VirD4
MVPSLAPRGHVLGDGPSQGREMAIHIGCSMDGEAYLPFKLDEGNRFLFAGATGAGKTSAVLGVTRAVVQNEQTDPSLIFMDPKGDIAVLKTLEALSAQTGKKLIIWTPNGLRVFNPFGAGTATEIVDKLLCGEDFKEPHYYKQAKWFLDLQIRIMMACGEGLSLRSIAFNMHPKKVKAMLAKIEPTAETKEYWGEIKDELESLTPDEEKGLMGTRRRLAGLARGDLGPWLDPRTPGAEPFDLLSAVREKSIVYFRLDSDNRPLESAALGGAIVHDINTTMAHLEEGVRKGAQSTPALVVLDEFVALAADVTRVFARGRSANMSVILATQTYHADLEGLDGRRERLENNLDGLIAMRQLSLRSAEDVVELVGKEEYTRQTRNDKGGVTEVEDERLRIAADQVQKLGRGEAVRALFGRTDQERETMVRLNPPEQMKAVNVPQGA